LPKHFFNNEDNAYTTTTTTIPLKSSFFHHPGHWPKGIPEMARDGKSQPSAGEYPKSFPE
jgi:hypothetical protein